jgi:hypothetical protein
MLAELLDDSGAALVKKLVSAAKSGQPWALRLCVDRLLPKYERRVELDLPRVDGIGDVAEATASVLDLAARGELTIEEARAFLTLIEHQRKALETSELAVRLELLEQRGGVAPEREWD